MTAHSGTSDTASSNDGTGDTDPRRGLRIAHLPEAEAEAGPESTPESGLFSASGGQAEHGRPHEQMRHGAAAGWCRFPGCRNRRQPRLSRRGAPPAYCTEAGHHPEGARRERVRRRRLELAAEAILDEHDQPLPAVSALPPDDDPDAADNPDDPDGFCERDSERGVTDSGETGAGPLPQPDAVGPAERLGLAVVPAPHGWSGWSGWSGGSGGSGVEVDPAEHARRLADQLALAATAYEHVAEKTAELQAANAELTRRLAATHRTNHPEPGPGPSLGPAGDPAPRSMSGSVSGSVSGDGSAQPPGDRGDHRP